MFAVHSFAVLCALLSLCASTPFRPRGNDSTASNWNRTSIWTSSSVVATPRPAPTTPTLAAIETPPYPFSGPATAVSSENGRPRPTGQVPLKSPPSRNETGPASCTVNIPSARIDWWYLAAFQHIIATLTSFAANDTNGGSYLATILNTNTFDVTSALSTDLLFTETSSYNAEWDWTITFMEEYTVRPTAAMTSIVTRTAAVPLPSDGFVPVEDIRQYSLPLYDLAPATFAITGAPNSAFTATSATPFLYFTAYEVESAVLVTAENGRIGSSATTETIRLPNVHMYPYWLKGIEDYTAATGPVPEEFLQQISQSACSAGTIQAIVTVLVVVDLTYINLEGGQPFFVHEESSVTGFEVIATDDPRPLVFDTGRPGTTPQVLNPPIVEQTADGFLTTIPVIKPAVSQTAATTTSARHEAGTGSNIPQGVMPPEQTRQISVTVGTIGTVPVVIGPSSVIVVGSQTLQPGGPAITIGGQPVSLVSSATAIVVGGKTSNLPQVNTPSGQVRPPPVLTIGSTTLTGNAATQFFIAPGQTLTAGGTATVDGTIVSLAPSASFIVIGGSTQVFPTAAVAITARPEIVIGGSTFTANPENPASAPTFVIFGQTLAPNQVITIDGTTISLAPSASFVVINGATSILPNPAAAQITAPPLTIGQAVFTALPGSGTTYIIGTHTLTPGGAITIADTTISLAPGATALIINGQTTLISNAQTQPSITNPPLLTIGSQTYTAAPGIGTTFLIGFETLTPGGTVTIDGTTIILAPGATQLIYGSSGRTTTTALFPATTTRSQLITGTGTSEPSAGATGANEEAAATTSQKGAGWSVKSKSKVGSGGLSLLIGILGLVMG